ncbi:uncharacterized protein DS421_5g135860 [Arachis hypogaea]|nr:uncharacterized protein DS421_5g135860 [Arachis hypogaea]
MLHTPLHRTHTFLPPSPSATNSPTNPDLLTAPSSSLSSVYRRTTATRTSSLLSPSPFLVAPLPLRRPPRLHAASAAAVVLCVQ